MPRKVHYSNVSGVWARYISGVRRKFFVVGLVILTADAQNCFVNIKLGPVQGSLRKSIDGNPFCSYRRIPYAKPPLGDLRFKAPLPPDPWVKPLNAKHDAHFCIQKVFGSVRGKEDCLYLNVYTPIKELDDNKKYPVIVYIHGGYYTQGSGAGFLSGPRYLLNKDIVLVTMNYRLGALGFLCTGDDVAPGNYAMKDQVAALKWVQDNIAIFGGNPESVTIMGHSAGSKSVHFQMFSPLSKGLFHKAISQSGSVFMAWVLPPEDPLAKAKKQALALGCLSNSSEILINCLRNIPARELVKYQLSQWQPVLETETALNPEPFLTVSPLKQVQIGDFYKVPWLMGSTSEDGALFGIRRITNDIEMKKISENLNDEGPNICFLRQSVHNSLIPEVWQKVQDFYFADNTSVKTEEMIKLYTDRYVVHGVHKAAWLHSMAGHKPIYRYNFAYRGLYSFGDKLKYLNKFRQLGVVHRDDLIYLVPLVIFNRWPPGHPDKLVTDLMVDLWTNFATYGNPTPHNEWGGTWKPYDTISQEYLNIGHSQFKPKIYGIRPVALKMKSKLYKHRMDFWDSLPLKENELF